LRGASRSVFEFAGLIVNTIFVVMVYNGSKPVTCACACPV
jgi:hypothetical protein